MNIECIYEISTKIITTMGFRKQACVVVLILVLCAGSVILCLSMKPPQVNLLKSTQGSAVLSICSSRLAAVVTQLSDRHTESALRGLWRN